MEEIVELEKQGLQTLASQGDAGRRFYGSVLRDAVMLFGGGIVVQGRQRILDSFGATPWKSFLMENVKVIPLNENAAVVAYKVTAQREGGPPYVALIGSAYARCRGEWKLAVHQQTPV